MDNIYTHQTYVVAFGQCLPINQAHAKKIKATETQEEMEAWKRMGNFILCICIIYTYIIYTVVS